MHGRGCCGCSRMQNEHSFAACVASFAAFISPVEWLAAAHSSVAPRVHEARPRCTAFAGRCPEVCCDATRLVVDEGSR